MSSLVVLLLVLVGGVALYLVVRGLTRLGTVRLHFDVSASPSVLGARVEDPANLGGGVGEGIARLRGNGVLGLAGDDLVFVLGTPRRRLSVPLSAITDVTVEASLRLPGRTVGGRHPWLVVHWADEHGRACLAGFLVPEPDRWRAELLGLPGGLGS